MCLLSRVLQLLPEKITWRKALNWNLPMTARRQRLLRQLPTLEDCQEQANFVNDVPTYRWLTPRRAAILEAALVSLAFLLCVWVLAS